MGIAAVTVVLTCCLTQGVKAFCLHRGASRGVTRTATMATAFENQLDSLYSAEAMDISTDIQVLDTFLKSLNLAD